MSIFSDCKCGALTEEEFKMECTRMNNQDRYEQEHEFDDYDEEREEDYDE